MKLTVALAVVFSLTLRLALAAGGHHSVDDAALVEPGQCQVEIWHDHERGGEKRLLHAGPACRAGGVELGLGVDRVQSPGITTTILSAQFKWAQQIHPGLSAGVAFSTAVGDRPPHRLVDGLVVPLTWQASESLLVHANVGRDQIDGGPSSNRTGAALEWSPTSLWSFVGERFREGGKTAWRLGARRELASGVSVDLSRAQGLHRDPRPWWTLGVCWTFAR